MNHVAVVLAAGGSTRLGRPKQLLTIGGVTLVHRAVRLALDTGPACTIVVTGAHHDAVAAAVADLRCVVVHNAGWESGLAGSLAMAATALPPGAGRALVLGCDQPRMQADHLRALLAARWMRKELAPTGLVPATPLVAAASGYCDIVGVPACVPAAWLGDLGEKAGDRGLGQRLRALADDTLAVFADEALGDDIDTPEQLAAAMANGWLDRD